MVLCFIDTSRENKILCNQIIAYIFVQSNHCMMEMRRDVFQAIADPTRRKIIEVLIKQPLNVNDIAQHFDVSRQAVSVHVKILSECGLVTTKQQGRERYCEAKNEKLNEVAAWVDYCRKFWKEQFDSLDQYLEAVQTNKKSKK